MLATSADPSKPPRLSKISIMSPLAPMTVKMGLLLEVECPCASPSRDMALGTAGGSVSTVKLKVSLALLSLPLSKEAFAVILWSP